MRNLLKMERYQLLHNKIYWLALLGVFLMGYFTAESYEIEWGGPYGGAASLIEIFNGMVYDSALPLVVLGSLLALLLGQEFAARTIDLEICAGHPRGHIFFSKVITYLAAFNIMAILYPVAGCIREYSKFGFGGAMPFWSGAIKGIAYSFLLNSGMFLIAVLCCFCFRNGALSSALTAGIMFALSAYFGYGAMWGLPVFFLPTYQIREAIISSTAFLPMCLLVGVVWLIVLTAASWRVFRKCDLK